MQVKDEQFIENNRLNTLLFSNLTSDKKIKLSEIEETVNLMKISEVTETYKQWQGKLKEEVDNTLDTIQSSRSNFIFYCI